MGSEIRVADSARSHRVELLLGELGGSPVSWLIINDLEVKVGKAFLKMGGVGGVGTLEEHRMKGYSRKVMEFSIEYMVRNGYDVSMLFGIPDYYVKWGYASTLPNCKITMPLRNAERARPGLKARPMVKEDAGVILDIYELANEHRTGPLKRHRGEWFRFRKGSWWGIPADGTVFEDESGRIVAYCASDRWPRVMRITEVGAVDVALYEHVLRYACDVAFQKKATELEIYVPFDHPFAELCKSLGCTVSIDYPYASDGMGRIVNIKSTFEKLVPVFKDRLEKACVKELPSQISFKTDIGLITLEISDSGVSISEAVSTNWIELPQWVLMQLILGYRDPKSVVVDQAVKHEGRVEKALETLFPSGNPHIWHSDWF
ncbi:MAG: GNAT family N-acetyltransferase [Thermoproteota archaeon]